MPDVNTVQPGQRVGGGRFMLRQQLGRGGMGEVWLAQDETLGELVALKFLPPEIRGDVAALQYLRTETARSHRLSHTHIIRIHDLHEDPGGLAFISMEYVEGPTLEALRVQQPGLVFSWEFLRPLVGQLCAALEYAHGENVVHRDLKPSNVMLDGKGRVKLADFGIAAVVSDSVSRISGQGSTSGTLLYMSPQQLSGRRPQVTDDIYALGATLYELLTSRPPFYTGDVTHQVLNEMPEALEARLAAQGIQNEIPPEVSGTVMGCLAKEPEQRPRSAAEAAERLEDGPRSEEPASLVNQAEHGENSARSERRPGKRVFRWILSSAGAVLLLAMGIWYSHQREVNHAKEPKSWTKGRETLVNVVAPQNSSTSGASKLPIQDGLVLYFSFDDAPNGGLVRDQSGLGNDGQVVGAKWVQNGRRTGALGFGSGDTFVVAPCVTRGMAQGTLEVWFNPNSWQWATAKNGLYLWAATAVPLGSNSGHDGMDLGNHQRFAGSGGLMFGIFDDLERKWNWVRSGVTPRIGVWQHVAVTWGAKGMTIYVNGALKGTNSFTGPAPGYTINTMIGRSSWPGSGIDGLVDEVGVFNRALAAEEIRQLYETAIRRRSHQEDDTRKQSD